MTNWFIGTSRFVFLTICVTKLLTPLRVWLLLNSLKLLFVGEIILKGFVITRRDHFRKLETNVHFAVLITPLASKKARSSIGADRSLGLMRPLSVLIPPWPIKMSPLGKYHPLRGNVTLPRLVTPQLMCHPLPLICHPPLTCSPPL